MAKKAIQKKIKKQDTLKYFIPLLILIIGISVGYAYLSSTLRISGRTSMPGMAWDVHFENAQEDSDSVPSVSPISLEKNNTKLNFNTLLKVPGEKYSFTVDVVNKGTIDAMVDEILLTGLSINQSKISEFQVSYIDGSEITKNDLLKAGDSEKVRVTLKYLDITEETLNSEDEEMDLSVNIKYIQANDKAVKRN